MDELLSRIHRLVLGVLLLASTALLVTPVHAQQPKMPPGRGPVSSVFGDITVTPEPMPAFQQPPSYGYVEYRFTLANKSPTDAHRVTLDLPKYKGSWYVHYLRSVRRTVEVGPSSSVTVSLWQPNLPIPSSGVDLIIDGRSQTQTPLKMVPLNPISQRGSTNSPYYQYRNWTSSTNFNNYRPCVLVSPSVGPLEGRSHIAGNLPLPPGQAADNLGTKGRQANMFHGGNVKFSRSTTPVTAWSSHWLSYSCYAGIVVTSRDLETLSGTRQGKEILTALWRYTECGSTLVIVGAGKVPEPWELRQKQFDGLTGYYAGFGRCFVLPITDVNQWQAKHWRPVVDSWLQTEMPWPQIHSPVSANTLFPVVDNLEIPVRGLFLVMLVFALTIGPGNLYVLSRAKRRLWMLWTVPTVSLATCAAIFGYMIATEGLQGHVRTEGLTILDETNRRATSIGWTAFYSPLTPGDGLHFSYDTELIPHLAQAGYSLSGRTPREIDWTEEQHCTAGWVKARVPAHFLVRKSESRAEHVTVSRDDSGTLTLDNKLGAEIRQLYLADKNGRTYTAEQVPADGQAVLKPRAAEPSDLSKNIRGLRSIYVADWLEQIESLTTSPEQYLMPGCYVAQLAAAPFIEEGLRGADTAKRSLVVYGIMKEPPE
jgi:hypothetical protein